MKQALEKKDLDLAAPQKEAREKTALADKKLASVGKLEEENSKLKAAVSDANWEVERLKKDKDKLVCQLVLVFLQSPDLPIGVRNSSLQFGVLFF